MNTVPSFRMSTESDLLLREMSHRINNEFASAIGMVSLAAARSPSGEVKAALNSVLEKLHSYAQVHRALEIPRTSSRIDASSYLSDLCRLISSSKLAYRNIELVYVERPPIQLTPEMCWKLGMVISELITNIVRHAFDERGGTIRVELKTRMGQIECRVSDNGVGMEVCTPGNGTTIINALVDGIGGNFEQYSGPDGTLSIIGLPVAN
jgi:two-component sensor histidine kinase